MAYIDGLVIPVKRDRVADYWRLAHKVGQVWIVHRSKRERDALNKKVMADPRIAAIDPAAMPIDGRRMFWGGFKEIVAVVGQPAR